MKRNIVLMTTALFLTGTLAACTGSQKTDCWKAKHNTIGKDCSSGNAGYSKHTPGIKSKPQKTKDTTAQPTPDAPDTEQTSPSLNHGGTNQNEPDVPAQDNSPTNDVDSEPNVPEQDQNANPPRQGSSGDIQGYDPFGGLYGPGT